MERSQAGLSSLADMPAIVRDAWPDISASTNGRAGEQASRAPAASRNALMQMAMS